MIIGGEHFLYPRNLFNKSRGSLDGIIKELRTDYHVNFTFGGYYSILAILDDIKEKIGVNIKILLPSYLCSSILKPFKSRNISYDFYRIDEDLLIDVEHLSNKINYSINALFIIDYFGISQKDRLEEIIKICREKKIILIQDIVQCLKIETKYLFGDYVFNSFRKFFPIEGSLLLSKSKMDITFNNNYKLYLLYKRLGQIIRYFHVKIGLFPSRLFLFFFNKSETCYYSERILRMPKFNTRQLNKYDFKSIETKQRKYFLKLYNIYHSFLPTLFKINDIIPLGFVMKVQNRNAFRKKLSKKNIFTPIHWILPAEINKIENESSIKLSENILTIPLVNLTDNKFIYLSKSIEEALLK